MAQRLDYKEASPVGMNALAAVHGYVRKSGLRKRLIDLVFLRVSQINGCAYCIDLHSHDLLKAGLPIDHLILVPVWREAQSIFDREERAALAWAEAVTRLGEHGISDSAYEAAFAAFGEKPLSDLTIAISLMNAYNRISISFRAMPMALSGAVTSKVDGAK
jgi:AhpD family alkylhydroperoxidase